MTDQLSREAAILKLAARCGMARLSPDDLDALCELADDSDGLTLAEMVMDKSLWRPDDELAALLLSKAKVTIRGEE